MAATDYRPRQRTPPAPTGSYNTPAPPAPSNGTYTTQPVGTPVRKDDGSGVQVLPIPSGGFPGLTKKGAGGAADSGGSGGGGAGGGGGWDVPGFPDPAAGQSAFTWGLIQGIASGKDVPFGPNEVNSEKSQAKGASENAFSQAKGEIQGQQAATGFASSPAAERQIVEARIGASQQYGKASNQILINAAQQNFNARLSALQSAQQWIDSLRNYNATLTTSWWDKQARQAELDLAQQRLDEEKRQFDITTGLNAAGGQAPVPPGA